ncbi:unnamed protein product, partial [Owenia fusiformis]
FWVKMLPLVLLFIAAASAGPSCRYSEWDEWDQCERSALCPRPVEKSFKTNPSASVPNDVGRQNGIDMMALKEELWSRPNPQRTRPNQIGAPVTCSGGYAGTYECLNVDQQSFINLDTLDGADGMASRANDNWGWTDPTNNREYVIMGLDDGTSFVDMTDPVNPIVLAYLPTSTVASNWRDMKVVNDHAFIVSEAAGHGMQVFDLRRLRGMSGPTQTVQADAVYDRLGNVHNIISNPQSNTVFLVGATNGDQEGCLAGLHMIDVSDPTNPTFTGCFADDFYVHDAQCHQYNGPDTDYQGREVCYCYNEDQMAIVDVTDKANPTYISTISYPGAAYTHQGWITEDYTTILLDDEQDESRSFEGNTRTYIFDVRDLDNPELRNTFYSAREAIDHNQYILGDYTFQSNYEVGLRILRIDQANYNLEEVAFFDVDDTTPGGLVSFQGSWNNYPYFASGNIPVTSIELGLFIVRPNFTAMEAQHQSANNGYQYRTRELISGSEDTCPAVKERRECVAPAC